jgi:hypothetical protein
MAMVGKFMGPTYSLLHTHRLISIEEDYFSHPLPPILLIHLNIIIHVNH